MYCYLCFKKVEIYNTNRKCICNECKQKILDLDVTGLQKQKKVYLEVPYETKSVL